MTKLAHDQKITNFVDEKCITTQLFDGTIDYFHSEIIFLLEYVWKIKLQDKFFNNDFLEEVVSDNAYRLISKSLQKNSTKHYILKYGPIT